MIYLFAWLVATSLMTLFSYLFYYITKNEAREPYLLSYIISEKFSTILSPKVSTLLGWILHYMLGIVFLCLNIFLIEICNAHDSLLSGIPFGIVAGLIGMMGWHFLFKIANGLPKINFPVYYFQLLLAHIVFCFSAMFIQINFIH